MYVYWVVIMQNGKLESGFNFFLIDFFCYFNIGDLGNKSYCRDCK